MENGYKLVQSGVRRIEGETMLIGMDERMIRQSPTSARSAIVGLYRQRSVNPGRSLTQSHLLCLDNELFGNCRFKSSDVREKWVAGLFHESIQKCVQDCR